jgi:hypothetical protein
MNERNADIAKATRLTDAVEKVMFSELNGSLGAILAE